MILSKFIEVTKEDRRNKVLVAIDDISCIFEGISGNGTVLYLKSDPKESIMLQENIEQIEKLLCDAQ